jgi:AcrR family transcriptional regulator
MAKHEPADSDTSAARGRPRDPDVSERILRATLDALGRHGFAQMSVDMIAAEAGVSKPTIYRRWASKIGLATAAIELMPLDDPPTEVESVWDGMRIELELLERAVTGHRGMAIIGSVLASEDAHPELLEKLREGTWRTRHGRLRKVIRGGIASGQLPESTDVDFTANVLLGYFYTTQIGGEPRAVDWAARCVAFVRGGISAQASNSTESLHRTDGKA